MGRLQAGPFVALAETGTTASSRFEGAVIPGSAAGGDGQPSYTVRPTGPQKGLETRRKYTVYSCTHSNVHTFLPYCILNTSFTHTVVLKICVLCACVRAHGPDSLSAHLRAACGRAHAASISPEALNPRLQCPGWTVCTDRHTAYPGYALANR